MVGAGGLLGAAALVPGIGSTTVRADTAPTSVTYTTPGEHTFVVPAGVTSIQVVANGENGHPGSGTNGGAGGAGAHVTATLEVHPGNTLYAEVSIDGGSGGVATDTSNPPPAGGNGGGESDLRTCSVSSCEPSITADTRLLVAGGGGGGAPGFTSGAAVRPAPALATVSSGGAGGSGSSACDAGTGGSAGVDSTAADQGHGGTCSTGGPGGHSASNNADGGPGSLVVGGQGGTTASVGGGGGGAGFFGGGGGAADNDDGSVLASGAGGGGSSCVPCVHKDLRTDAVSPAITHSSITLGGGAPLVTISWTAPATPTPTPTATPTATPTPTATLPSTGAGPVSGAWEPLVVGGLVLYALGAFAGRRRGGDSEAP